MIHELASNQSAPGNLPRRAQRAVTALVVISAALCVYAMRQADPDLFGYLAYGRLFLENGGVTTSDPFAYTSEGLRWVPFEYMAQILLWVSYSWFGPLGLIALKCLVGGLAMGFMYAAIKTASDNPIAWIPTFLLSAAAVSRFFLFRPQVFTFALFSLFTWALFRYLIRGRWPLWLLPPAMLIWANIHGGFLAGLGAIGLALLLRISGNLNASSDRSRRLFEGTTPLFITLAASVALTFLNPQGIRLWTYVVTEVLHGTNRRYIAEWGPVSWRGDAWSATSLTLLAIVLSILGLMAWRGAFAERERSTRHPVPVWSWILSCVPLVVMAYVSVRHVPLAFIWAAPVVTLLGSEGLRSERQVVFRRILTGLSACAAAAVTLTLVYVIGNPRPTIATGGNILGVKHPCGAVRYVKQHDLSGNLYTPLWWGSYITWETYPAVRVSMDGRNISLFPDNMVVDNLRFYSGEAKAADLEVPLRYRTDYVLVPADAPVLALVRNDPRWRPIYSDDDASLFARANRPAEGDRSVGALQHGAAEQAAPADAPIRRTSEDCSQILGR